MPPKVSKDTTHGWLVVATCSAAFFLFTGNASCLGLVEVELSSLFKDSGSSLSAINALYNGLGWGLAPVVAALTKFFSCRLLSCCGSFLCFLGFFVASTSQSLLVIVFCTGVLPGIGFSLMVVSSNILLSEYFDKKRPLALIISVIGGGMGIVVFPHIFTTLNQTYGIHGTFLILSALNSHGIMFSILYDVSLANSKPRIFISITPPVLIDLFGVDKLSSTLGTNYLVIGTGYILGGPLMRHLSLAMSAIDPVFYTSAGCTVMGMLLIMTVSCDSRSLARILKMFKRHFAPVSIPPVLPVNTDGGIFTISYRKY
nr:monocarboxylate transporter 6 isoform X3 [Crassostrea gigas]